MPGFRPVVSLLAILPALLFAIIDMDFLPQKGAVGLFRVPKEEGFGALAQRLGARSVLTSLWPVADASTPTLMREFYRLHRANPKLGKAAGLRQAQLELLRGSVTASTPPSKANRARRAKVAGAANMDLPLFAADPKAPYAHPYYWAPFVLIGNPQ